MRRICLLGVAASALEHDQLAEIPADAEIWAVNEAHRGLGDRKLNPEKDRVFQLHVRNWRESERRYLNDSPKGMALPEGCDTDCFGRNNEHVEYLRTCGVPVYGQQVWTDIPTSIRYPFETVTKAVGIRLPPEGNKRLWVTSSFGYMAALALTEHLEAGRLWEEKRLAGVVYPILEEFDEARVENLLLVGIELPLGTTRERLWEWPNFAYYLGLATGFGIKITLPSTGTSLLSAPHYALDGHPYPQEADHWFAPGYSGVVYDPHDDTLHLGTTTI